MFDFKLPDYEIIVWIDNNDFGEKLEKEILFITKNFEIYEEIVVEDKRVHHWIIPTWEEAIETGDKLKQFIENPNLIFLKLKANYNSKIQDITLKDIRKFMKHNKTKGC